jgi:hypothetical protein
MPFRPTGIDTPLGGFSWEYTTSPKQRISELFFYLESKRILTNPIYMEVVSQCVDSAIQIRDALASIIKDVKFPDEDKHVLSSMIEGSNSFLDELNKIEGITPHLHLGVNLFDYSIKKYREAIKAGIVYFERTYNLQFSKRIDNNRNW